MMTRHERVRAALAGEETDRLPVSAWGHVYDQEWVPERLAAFTAHSAREFDWDWVKLQNRETCFAEALGACFRPDPSGAAHPVPLHLTVETTQDWQQVIDRARRPGLPAALQEQVDLVRDVDRRLDGDWPILQTVFSPLSVIGYLVGRDQAAAVDWLRREPALLTEVMNAVAEMLERFVDASLEAGAAGIYFAVIGYASAGLMTLQEYRDLVLPIDQRVAARAEAGWFNMAHLCFDHIYFEVFDELPVGAVSWSTTDPGNPSLSQARERTSKALVGGLGRRDPIASGSSDDVLIAASAVSSHPMPGLMLAPGCSVSPWPVERPHNFKALRRASQPGPPLSLI